MTRCRSHVQLVSGADIVTSLEAKGKCAQQHNDRITFQIYLPVAASPRGYLIFQRLGLGYPPLLAIPAVLRNTIEKRLIDREPTPQHQPPSTDSTAAAFAEL